MDLERKVSDWSQKSQKAVLNEKVNDYPRVERDLQNQVRIIHISQYFFSMDFFFLNNTRKVLAWQKIQPSLGLHSRGTQIIKLKFITRHT